MRSIGGNSKKKAHLLAIPIGNHGHLIPMLRFMTELARRGVTITVVLYEDLLGRLTSKGSLSELQCLGVRFVGLHNPWGPTNNIPVEDARNLWESFQPLLEKLLRDRSSGVAGPTSFISDMFLTWAQDLSERLEIPWYMFIPSGATLVRLMQGYIWFFAQKQFRIAPDGKLEKFDGTVDIAGLPPLRYHEFIFTAINFAAMFLVRCQVMCKAAGVVVNTFYDLEEKVIESIIGPGHTGFEENKVAKIYPAGPLFSTSGSLRSIAVTSGLDDSADESILWLNKQPSSSVLYVAFGTMAELSAGEIHELALGLESSNQRFLWVLPQRKGRPNVETPSVTDLLPQGYLARVGDRGLIVTGWAPQLQILAHAATGGFLTHAGWNSSMESITIGVPILCWPQWAEQHLNCRYMVDDLKIAGQIQTGPDNILDRKEVERAVRMLMAEPEGKEMRTGVEELKRKAAEAVAEDGPMSRAIDQFALDLSALEDFKKV